MSTNMTKKEVETQAFALGVYFEDNRIYFENKLPEIPEISFHKFRVTEAKYNGLGKFVLSGYFVFDPTDTAEQRKGKEKQIADAVHHMMSHMAQELAGKAPKNTGIYKDIIAKIDSEKIPILGAEIDEVPTVQAENVAPTPTDFPAVDGADQGEDPAA